MSDLDFNSPGDLGLSDPEPVMHMQTGARICHCSHTFPICAGDEQLDRLQLLVRSRWLSSLAGWPARVTREEAASVVAGHGRPVLARQPPSATPAKGGDCGCGAERLSGKVS